MTNVLNIEELFAGRLLTIPDYQRGYAWEIRQWNEFMEDVELLPNEKDHFTGTVVLHEDAGGKQRIDEMGKKYSHFNVVDGQQRLTTVILVLDALRHEMQQHTKLSTLVSGIVSTYLHVGDLNGERIHKMTLNRDCHAFFVNSILGEPPGPEGPVIASHQRLRDAKKFFRGYLAKEKPADLAEQHKWLVNVYDKITHRLRLSLYTVTEASDVGVIFEVMNNRGKPLSELEKVKNYLLYLGSKLALDSHTLPEAVNQTWTNIFERLMAADLSGSQEENQLLRMHWLMAYNHRSRKFDGSNSIKLNFRLKTYEAKHKELLAQLQRYTKGLDQASLAYCDIMNPTRSDAFAIFKGMPIKNKIVHASEKLERISVVATFLPLLIAVRIRFPEDGEKYLELVELCEIFAFRVYRITRRRADAGQKTIFRLANELYGSQVSFEDALQQLRSELLSYCPNHEFEESFKVKDQGNNWYDSAGLKYLLYEYEEHLAGSHTVQLPWKAVAKRPLEQSIEHILPQTPSHEYWKARFDETTTRRLLHDIGNLCLTTDNSAYGNKSFPDKKGSAGGGGCYANSNLFQERELASYPEWTQESILHRRGKITEWALDRWRVDDAGVEVVPASIEDEDDEDGEELPI